MEDKNFQHFKMDLGQFFFKMSHDSRSNITGFRLLVLLFVCLFVSGNVACHLKLKKKKTLIGTKFSKKMSIERPSQGTVMID